MYMYRDTNDIGLQLFQASELQREGENEADVQNYVCISFASHSKLWSAKQFPMERCYNVLTTVLKISDDSLAINGSPTIFTSSIIPGPRKKKYLYAPEISL